MFLLIVLAQVIIDEKPYLLLHINQKPIVQWFRGQLKFGQTKLIHNIGEMHQKGGYIPPLNLN